MYKTICVNANYKFGNDYIGIGVLAEVKGEPELLKPEDWKKWEWISINKLPENLFVTAKDTIECYRSGKMNISE